MLIETVEELVGLVDREVFIADTLGDSWIPLKVEVLQVVIKKEGIKRREDGPVCPHVLFKEDVILGAVPLRLIGRTPEEAIECMKNEREKHAQSNHVYRSNSGPN
jgi:hypothetical protein